MEEGGGGGGDGGSSSRPQSIHRMNKQSASPKMQLVRDALREMGLPPEMIESAIQARGNGGDLNEIAAYALNLHDNPQAECIEEHPSDDMVSSDEDVKSDSMSRWIQSTNKLGGSIAQASSPKGNKLLAFGRNMESTADKVEEALLGVQGDHQPLPHVVEWEDPICKLFQGENNNPCNLQSNDEGGSWNLNDPVKQNVELTWSAKTEDRGGDSDKFFKGKSVFDDPHPSQDVSRSGFPKLEQREASFRDMGFSTELIQRAIQLHGAEADDSMMLQFLLDWRETHAQKSHDKSDEDSDSDLAEDEVLAIRRNVAALVTRNPQTVGGPKDKHVATGEPNWDSEDSDPSASDSDSDQEASFGQQSPPAEFAKPAPLCRREVPAGGGHRQLMRSHGFHDDLIERAIQELGEGVEFDMLLEYLLYLVAQQDPKASISDSASNKRVSTVEKLVTEFQYPTKAVEKAMKLCNTPSWNADQDQIVDLLDFLAAHGGGLDEEEESGFGSDEKAEDGSWWTWLREQVADNGAASARGKRKIEDRAAAIGKPFVRRGRGRPPKVRLGGARATQSADVAPTETHRGSVGFGLPGTPVRPRYLSEDVKGAPFFYFENVASMPAEEWARIQRHLFDIEPEFVDSQHFSACRRPRGYIHNLPIEGRRKLLADPPMTIQELMPQTRAFWPAWDPRTKLNCINTKKGSEFLAKKLLITEGCALQTAHPSAGQQQEILRWCRRWNLVWTAPNIPTPITENEIEAILGFDADHSRNCLNTTARFKVLGNSFSVYTVAFHFSVLKPLYARGIKVLSLFSGIGGAEVALHKLGIELLVVVSVEINEGARRCLQAWWASSKQTGILNQSFHNVKDLGRAELSELVSKYGGFDLVVGGSPCNNLSGNNHVNRVGLDGKQSTVFFEFSRIVSTVREFTIRLQDRR